VLAPQFCRVAAPRDGSGSFEQGLPYMTVKHGMEPDDAFLDKAFHAHTESKVKVRAAITKQETLDAETIGADDKCTLGKWLHGKGKTRYGKLPAFSQCVSSLLLFTVLPVMWRARSLPRTWATQPRCSTQGHLSP